MLDINTAKIVKAGIKKELDIDLTLNDICRMQPIPTHERGGYTILAMQCGDLTILVWVWVDENGSVRVTRAKRVSW